MKKKTATLKAVDDYGVGISKKTTVMIDSRIVAQQLGKEHYNLLKDIRRLISTDNRKVQAFTAVNFYASEYEDSTGRKLPCYYMTPDGFMLLVSSYTGDKYREIQIRYGECIRAKQKQCDDLNEAKHEFPHLTDIVKALHTNPQWYHYANEADLVNRAAIGMTAKEYKKQHGIPEKEASIRPYLTADEIERVRIAQEADIILCEIITDARIREAEIKKVVAIKTARKQLEEAKALP